LATISLFWPFAKSALAGLRERLAAHFVQRRRVDINAWKEKGRFPDHKIAERTYRLTGDFQHFFEDVLTGAGETNPVGVAWFARPIAERLPRATLVKHRVASVAHGAGNPVPASRQFTRRSGLTLQSWWPGRPWCAIATVAQGRKLLGEPHLKARAQLGRLSTQPGDERVRLRLHSRPLALPVVPFLGENLA
jgi:hypothetical protein